MSLFLIWNAEMNMGGFQLVASALLLKDIGGTS
jgi:hypothetical protein